MARRVRAQGLEIGENRTYVMLYPRPGQKIYAWLSFLVESMFINYPIIGHAILSIVKTLNYIHNIT